MTDLAQEIADKSRTAHDPLPNEPLTELGYARRLVHVYGDRLRYVPAWRWWLVWDGKRWAHDTTGQTSRWMKSIARLITADALAIADKDKRASALRHAKRGESAGGVAGALTLAGTELELVITPDDLDADPFLLNCQNGIVDLRTGEIGNHDPALLLTKITGAAYQSGARGEAFEQFLSSVQPDESMRAYLARLLGHTLEGRQVVHILPIFHGEGSNGKSTLVNAAMSALGDYADAADPGLLTARGYDAHPTGVADLYGLRLAILHETDSGRRLAEGTVKRLTGGDRIKARRMREDFWHFDPTHTFVVLTNHRPVVGGTDEGLWRRLRLVPWPVVIRPEERDEELSAKLMLELDAVLTWLVDGCLDWRASGLDDPEQVTEATAAFRAESDALARFVSERCLTGPLYTVQSAELFAAWSKWCATDGEEAGTQTAFSNALTNRGFDKAKDGRGRIRWSGLGLAAEDEIPEPQP